MPLDDQIDLRPGSVLHIEGFATRGHPKKNKYVLILGRLTESEVLGFLVSSQLEYLQRETHKREVVRIPQQATAIFRHESIIQCFVLEYLLASSLCEGFERGLIENKGLLPVKYLHKVREVVRESRLLSQDDIEKALLVLPTPRA
jgi:hypothetical protein